LRLPAAVSGLVPLAHAGAKNKSGNAGSILWKKLWIISR